MLRESPLLLSEELLEIHPPIVMLLLVVMMAWNSSCSTPLSLAQILPELSGFSVDRVINLIFTAFPLPDQCL